MLQRLFIFLLIFLILPDIYLYLRFIVHLTATLAENPLLAACFPAIRRITLSGLLLQ